MSLVKVSEVSIANMLWAFFWYEAARKLFTIAVLAQSVFVFVFVFLFIVVLFAFVS